MDVTAILDKLNDKQREAVALPPTHALVLAGAGSGKTRVLVHRMAWLMQAEGVSPWGLMAVTFTNKAAAEMRERIERLVGRPAGAMWVGTFHGIAHRLLRLHYEAAGLPKEFQILDSDDQLRMVKRVIKDLNLDDQRWPPRQIQWFINGQKDEGLRPQHIEVGHEAYEQQLVRIYTAYEAACKRAGAVDFAELLLRCHELFLNNDDLVQHYRQRFGYLLIDEFQDTNTLQYAWIRVLAGATGKVFVVGDDDQSIYGWRGARVENIQRFTEHFAGAETILLEQNYRSTGNVLNAANAVIGYNAGRMGKNLWTDSGAGDKIQLYAASDEQDEARFVIERIRRHMGGGGKHAECAILYRSNAQSRVFEENLIRASIPYRVYGGLRFFDRQEIKDALAYLRLAQHRHDDAAFDRVVNTPPRGIGTATMEQVRTFARENGISLWAGAFEMVESSLLSNRAAGAFKRFADLMTELTVDITDAPLQDQVATVVANSGLIPHFQKEKGDRGEARLENLDELVSAARGFEPDEQLQEEGLTPLAAFLSHAALEAGEGQGDKWDDCVQLMTLHAAKGLEFSQVFLVGMEDGLFPNQRALDEPSGIEEERRLAYVGMTRAMQNLYLSWAERRWLHGRPTNGLMSQFIREIPEELLDEQRSRFQMGVNTGWSGNTITPQPIPKQSYDIMPYALGDHVQHGKFGAGTVLSMEGAGDDLRVQVNFADAGVKWLVARFANLQKY